MKPFLASLAVVVAAAVTGTAAAATQAGALSWRPATSAERTDLTGAAGTWWCARSLAVPCTVAVEAGIRVTRTPHALVAGVRFGDGTRTVSGLFAKQGAANHWVFLGADKVACNVDLTLARLLIPAVCDAPTPPAVPAARYASAEWMMQQLEETGIAWLTPRRAHEDVLNALCSGAGVPRGQTFHKFVCFVDTPTRRGVEVAVNLTTSNWTLQEL